MIRYSGDARSSLGLGRPDTCAALHMLPWSFPCISCFSLYLFSQTTFRYFCLFVTEIDVRARQIEFPLFFLRVKSFSEYKSL